MRTLAYRIAAIFLVAAFFATCGAAYFGWLLSATATTREARTGVSHRASARVGTHITGGGSHFGK